MSDAADIAARIRQARLSWCALDERRAVQVQRPGWAARTRMASLEGRVEQLEAVLGLVVGWRGFTQADAEPGAGDAPLPFSAELWALLVDDHDAWIGQVVDHVAEQRRLFDAAAEAASGN